MPQCDHEWKYGEAATNATELLTRIKATGKKGLWIKDKEMILATSLIADDKIVMCDTCDRSATAV